MKKDRKCRLKGFTLVEIIVVLVILAILAAAMIPSLTGYIEKAKNQKYVEQTKEFVMAAQTGLVEAYALDQENFKEALRTGNLPAANGKVYGYFSSYYGKDSYRGIKNDTSIDGTANGARFKRAACNYLGDYLESKNIEMSDVTPQKDTKVSAFKGKCAFMIAFDEKAKVFFVQFVNEGKMVTYDGNSYVVSDDGKFLDFRNPPK